MCFVSVLAKCAEKKRRDIDTLLPVPGRALYFCIHADGTSKIRLQLSDICQFFRKRVHTIFLAD